MFDAALCRSIWNYLLLNCCIAYYCHSIFYKCTKYTDTERFQYRYTFALRYFPATSGFPSVMPGGDLFTLLSPYDTLFPIVFCIWIVWYMNEHSASIVYTLIKVDWTLIAHQIVGYLFQYSAVCKGEIGCHTWHMLRVRNSSTCSVWFQASETWVNYHWYLRPTSDRFEHIYT